MCAALILYYFVPHIVFTQIRGLEEEIYTLTSKCTSLEADNADALSSVRTLTTSVKEAELEKRALLLELSRARGLTSLQESKMKVCCLSCVEPFAA